MWELRVTLSGEEEEEAEEEEEEKEEEEEEKEEGDGKQNPNCKPCELLFPL